MKEIVNVLQKWSMEEKRRWYHIWYIYLTNILSKGNIGLYRDDELFIFRKINKQQTDKLRKKTNSIFKNINFIIEIVTNLTEADVLDVTFNLENNTYRPYKKSNEKLIYIDVSSNYPPQIKKRLTKIISDRLSRNSSNADTFNNTKLENEVKMWTPNKTNVYPT